jgi:hydroxypyruvate isomerase
MNHSLRYEVNCSIMFTELPLLERPAAAKAAGFDAVEFWWPWPHQPVPSDVVVNAFVTAVRDAGVRLVGLNFAAGDLAGPDCGLVSDPFRSEQFRDNIDVTIGIGELLGCTAFNALYGNRIEGVLAERQDELGRENLRLAALAAGRIGGTVLVESVSGPKPYPLRTAADAIEVIDRVGAANVGFLCDLYHLHSNGDDLDKALEKYAGRVAHVQIADAPGRGAPGTGEMDLDHYLTRLQRSGYTGWVGLEYKPDGPDTFTSLDWLPRERRAATA